MKCFLIFVIVLLTLASVCANFTEITSRTILLRNMRCGTRSNFITSEMSSQNHNSGNCIYTIRANSVRVCQLRLDFDSILAQPTTTATRAYPHCVSDAISVDGLGLEICGTNMAQHVYIPWDVQRLIETKEITIRLGDRATDGTLGPYFWNMKVTQIECPEKGILARQSNLRAPVGCTQYFHEATGTIQSFNLNSQNGPYLGDMNYAICIRRQASHTQLSLTPQFFELSIEDVTKTDEGYDELCLPQITTPNFSSDFLLIPGGVTNNGDGLSANRFCGTSLEIGTPVVTSLPGPFVLQFTSDTITSAAEKGFRFTYSLLSV